MSIADDMSRWLKAQTSDVIMPVEDVKVDGCGDLTEVTFFTESGQAVAVFNREGVRDLLDKLQMQYFS